MKRSILHICILLSAVFLCNTKMLAWGENVSYLLNSTTEYSMSTGISDFGGRAGETFAFDAPMARVEFEAKKSALSVSGFYVQISTDGNVWSDLSGELSLSTSFKSFSFDITDANARFIRFYAKTGATLTKTYRNIKVVRATSISAPTYVNMGEVTIGKSVSTTIKVQYNNTTYPQQITASCSNPAFTVTPVSVGECGTAELTVTFAPTMAGSFSDGVTLTMGNATTMFTVSGTATTDRSTPSFTWLLTSASTGQEYHDFFKTTNPECPYVITSSDESIAKVVDGVLHTYDVPGTVTFLVRQFANANWKPKEEKFTITVVETNNHLPLSIEESNQSYLVQRVSGSYTWDGGVKLGDGGGGFDWSDKVVQIAYTGIPDRISFDYACGNSTATGVSWIVRVSADGQAWTDIWSSSSNSGSADIEITNKSARYVRLVWSGNFGGYFRNVKITEYECFSTDVTSLDFGRNIYAQDVPARSIVLKHANAGPEVTVTSSNPDLFKVSPAVLATSGRDKFDETTIEVIYTNRKFGDHSGVITISDPNGRFDDILIDVKGTTYIDAFVLNPEVYPDYEGGLQERVFLPRVFPAGYSTVTLPFDYNISVIDGAFVGQLALVTYNQYDGYTLYIKKVQDGQMLANQPYVFYTPSEIANPEWADVTLVTPVEESITMNGWSMKSNYTPYFSMDGRYGIAGNKFRKGTAGATLNAYMAYFEPFVQSSAQVRMAVMEESGEVTYIDEIQSDSQRREDLIYRIDGRRTRELQPGLNIIRMSDGTTRKVLK